MRSSRAVNLNRRAFIKKTVLGTISLTAYQYAGRAGLFGCLPEAFAGPRPLRRHLINIIKGAGFDAYWFHSSMSAEMLRSSAYPSQQAGTSATSLPVQRVGPGANDRLTIRESYDPLRNYYSNGRQHHFGSAFQSLFRDTKLDNGNELMSKMSVWKGVSSPCRHGDNAILNMGVNSPYALSFSAIVADRLAADSPRDLHYAVLHSSPAEAYLNFAMNKGYAAPTCIPGLPGLANLTSVDVHDFPQQSRRDLIVQAVAKLSGGVLNEHLKLKSSVANAGVFLQSGLAASKVAGSKMDQDIELLHLRNRFREKTFQIMASYYGVASSGGSGALYANFSPRSSGAEVVLRAGLLYTRANPLPDLSAYRTNQLSPTQAAQLRAQLVSNISALNGLYPDLIDQFALSSYLVRRNLSAVIDFKDGDGGSVIDDAHHNTFPGQVKAMIFFTCYQQLMLSLDEVKEVNPGETLLDATHIVMHTEMDRTPWIGNDDFSEGTNHSDYSTSFLMAGYGINGGKVVGDLHHGPNDVSQFGAGTFTAPLPIDPNSGEVKSGGKIVTMAALAPTIVEMFGAKLPDNQISEQSFVGGIIRKKMVS